MDRITTTIKREFLADIVAGTKTTEFREVKSRGHEWRLFDGHYCCECGWTCGGSEDNDECRRKHVRHIASVAQAAQPPTGVLELLKVFADAKSSQCCDPLHPVSDEYKSRWEPYIKRAYELIEGSAQPQEVPAPYRNDDGFGLSQGVNEPTAASSSLNWNPIPVVHFVVPSNAYFVGQPQEVGGTCEKYRDAGEWAAITAEYLKEKLDPKGDEMKVKKEIVYQYYPHYVYPHYKGQPIYVPPSTEPKGKK